MAGAAADPGKLPTFCPTVYSISLYSIQLSSISVSTLYTYAQTTATHYSGEENQEHHWLSQSVRVSLQICAVRSTFSEHFSCDSLPLMALQTGLLIVAAATNTPMMSIPAAAAGNRDRGLGQTGLDQIDRARSFYGDKQKANGLKQ